MSHIDDLFRDGLSGRKADVPNTADLWSRINAAKQQPLPEGEALDRAFSDKLRDRLAPVPAGMWARITAARGRKPLVRRLLAAAALLLLLIMAGIGYNQAGGEEMPPQIITPAIDDAPIANTDVPLITKVASENAVRELPVADKQSDEKGIVKPNSTPAVATDIGLPASSAAIEPGLPITPAAQELPPSSLIEETVATSPAVSPNATLAIGALPGSLAELVVPKTALPETEPLALSTFRSRGSRGLQTELLFGISYARQEFSLQDPTAAALRNLRQGREYPEVGYQITLRGTYQLSEKIRLLGGLTYAEIRNELEYEVFSNGVTTLARTNNSIRMLEMPVLLGYSVPGRRVNVTINAGPVVNLATSARGRFLDPDFGSPRDLAIDGNYRNNIGVGFMTSLSTTYQIGKKNPFTLLVEPFFKAYPTAFTTKGAPLQENYWVAGIQLGVRKTLR